MYDKLVVVGLPCWHVCFVDRVHEVSTVYTEPPPSCKNKIGKGPFVVGPDIRVHYFVMSVLCSVCFA